MECAFGDNSGFRKALKRMKCPCSDQSIIQLGSPKCSFLKILTYFIHSLYLHIYSFCICRINNPTLAFLSRGSPQIVWLSLIILSLYPLPRKRRLLLRNPYEYDYYYLVTWPDLQRGPLLIISFWVHLARCVYKTLPGTETPYITSFYPLIFICLPACLPAHPAESRHLFFSARCGSPLPRC